MVDYVNAKENFIYISNLAFLISVLSDSLIFCCGDLLPLLSSATSPDFSQDVIQPCGGMHLETAFSFLNRVMSLVDTVVYTSNFSFGGVEVNRNLSTGGFLRQCTRLGEYILSICFILSEYILSICFILGEYILSICFILSEYILSICFILCE